jgi:hypothetical protein
VEVTFGLIRYESIVRVDTFDLIRCESTARVDWPGTSEATSVMEKTDGLRLLEELHTRTGVESTRS